MFNYFCGYTTFICQHLTVNTSRPSVDFCTSQLHKTDIYRTHAANTTLMKMIDYKVLSRNMMTCCCCRNYYSDEDTFLHIWARQHRMKTNLTKQSYPLTDVIACFCLNPLFIALILSVWCFYCEALYVYIYIHKWINLLTFLMAALQSCSCISLAGGGSLFTLTGLLTQPHSIERSIVSSAYKAGALPGLCHLPVVCDELLWHWSG